MDLPQALRLKTQVSFTTQCSEPIPDDLLEVGEGAETIETCNSPSAVVACGRAFLEKCLRGVAILTDSFK